MFSIQKLICRGHWVDVKVVADKYDAINEANDIGGRVMELFDSGEPAYIVHKSPVADLAMEMEAMFRSMPNSTTN